MRRDVPRRIDTAAPYYCISHMHASSSDTRGGTVEVRQTSSPAWADTDRPDGICSADVGIEVYLFSDLATIRYVSGGVWK
jgi:hypothetical protein